MQFRRPGRRQQLSVSPSAHQSSLSEMTVRLSKSMLKLNCPRKPILQQISVPSAEIFSEHGQLRIGANWAISEEPTVNPETPAPRSNPVLTVYRWPLAVVFVALIALFAF